MRFKLSFLIIIFVLASCNYSVKVLPKHAGVILNKDTGKISEHILQEGIHNLDSSEELILFDIAEQVEKISIRTVYKDGLQGTIELTVRYRPIINSLPKLYELYKHDYKYMLLQPEIRSNIRLITGRHNQGELDKPVLTELLRERLTSHALFSALIELVNIQVDTIE